jgi:hypothetical protein
MDSKASLSLASLLLWVAQIPCWTDISRFSRLQLLTMKYLIFYIYQPKTQLENYQNVIYQPNTNYRRTLDMKEPNKIHQFVGNKCIFRTTEFEHIVWLFMNLNIQKCWLLKRYSTWTSDRKGLDQTTDVWKLIWLRIIF